MLYIQEFIKEHPSNWKDLLTSEPYNLIIKEDSNLVLFKYMQGVSDYSLDIVKEARGLILDRTDFSVVCMGFTKFFIFNSEFADEIDWENVRIEEKYDGSLINLYYYNNGWRISTSGTINAYNAYVECEEFKSFGELFDLAAMNSNLNYDNLNKDYIYMLELISPYNKVVVDYDTAELIHIGTRNRLTLQECITDIGLRKPETYDIHDIMKCIEFVNNPKYHGEGFVAVDKDWHRIKIKSDEWLKFHYMNHNNAMNVRIALEIIRSDDMDEYIAKYTHHKDYILTVKKAYDGLRNCVLLAISASRYYQSLYTERKQLAEQWFKFVNTMDSANYTFKYRDLKMAYFGHLNNPNYSIDDFINNVVEDKLISMTKNIMEDMENERTRNID